MTVPICLHPGGSNQARCGMSISEFQGVLLYSKGTYVCAYTELFKCDYWRESNSDYRFLSENKANQSYQLIINGDFDVQANRNGIITSVKTELAGRSFCEGLRNALESFRIRGGTNYFDGILTKLSKQNSVQASKQSRTDWKKKVEGYRNRSRFEVEFIKAKRRDKEQESSKKFVFFEPESGMENTVINIYAQLSRAFPRKFFTKAKIPLLERLCPILIDVFAGEGTDAVGVPQDCNLQRLITDREDGIPSEDFLNIEFKLNFQVPIYQDGRKFNYDFTLTDFIISWDLVWPDERSTEVCVVQSDTKEKVYDEYGNSGIISSEFHHWKHGKVSIPDSMQGFCFFITNLRDSLGNTAKMTEERSCRSGIVVFSLKQLIKATFDHGDKPDAKSTLRWSTPEPAEPIASRVKKRGSSNSPQKTPRKRRIK